MKKLLFITTSTLASNPRLVKEFETLKHEHQCEVIYFYQQDWTMNLSLLIEQRNPNVLFYKIDRRVFFFDTLLSKIVHKMAIVINPIFKYSIRAAAYACHDRTFQLEKFAKKITKQRTYDVVLAHNLGAFYPAFKALGKKTKLHLDIEDFHPGEQVYFNSKYEIQNRILVMQKLLNKACKITYASPLIMKACLSLLNHSRMIEDKSYVINNCFSQKEFEMNQSSSKKIKLVWFSQNIAKDRGLEKIIPILNEFASELELHLIGNLNQDFKERVLNKYDFFIEVHSPMPQKELHLHLAHYDIGLAIEPGKDNNNNLALSNKIFAYLQSGLYILASSTPAQVQFMKKHGNIGVITNFSNSDLRLKIKSIIDNGCKIRATKFERFQYAKQFSWEVESLKLQELLY